MDKSNIKTTQRQSLRFRYFRFSAIVACLLIIGASVSSFHLKDVTHINAKSLQLRDSATQMITGIRQDIWRINTSLNSMLITPQATHKEAIKENLLKAEKKLEKLATLDSIDVAGLDEITADITSDLKNFKDIIFQLIELIKDPNWVYPMMPFINDTLLKSNNEFELATLLALQENAESDGDEYASEVYREIAQIRNLWKQQILDFRAIIIRFAGLNKLDRIAQEQNIAVINGEIENKLRKLEKRNEQGQLGLETEDALNIMQHSSKKWYADFQELKKIRDSKIWRADIHFVEENIRPLQAGIASDLVNFENTVQSWSSRNVAAVEQAANQINLELWGLTAAALTFVWLVYMMIARAVLTPIAKISDAITDNINKIDNLSEANKGSKEVHLLVSAFNTMRRQIHHRQKALEHQALHDSLTGLPNRALLNDRLEQAINIAQRQNTNVAIMLLDLDRFKEINDTLGHPTGDLVLQEVSSRLETCLRTSDTVARLGGDEFAIICPNILDTEATSFIEKIIDCTSQAIHINNQNLYTNVSIGIATYPKNSDNAASLIRQADVAMYNAKQNGTGYRFFHNDLDKLNAENLSLLNDLRDELKAPTGQLSLYYQPQINLKTLKIHSAEGLFRWHHPEKGLIPTSDVIHMIEQINLIDDLTTWVIERAIKDASIWRKNDIQTNVSINLSAKNFQNPELVRIIQNSLSSYNMNPNTLTIEITESAVMNDPVRAREIIDQLSSIGISLDIDDYGTGFSSLAYLKMLPVNGLKIDKSFVIDLFENEDDKIIVKSTIDLGHNLNLSVIAEGVETLEAYQLLKENQCDLAQGSYIACPMPADEFQKWYKAYDPKAA